MATLLPQRPPCEVLQLGGVCLFSVVGACVLGAVGKATWGQPGVVVGAAVGCASGALLAVIVLLEVLAPKPTPWVRLFLRHCRRFEAVVATGVDPLQVRPGRATTLHVAALLGATNVNEVAGVAAATGWAKAVAACPPLGAELLAEAVVKDGYTATAGGTPWAVGFVLGLGAAPGAAPRRGPPLVVTMLREACKHEAALGLLPTWLALPGLGLHAAHPVTGAPVVAVFRERPLFSHEATQAQDGLHNRRVAAANLLAAAQRGV